MTQPKKRASTRRSNKRREMFVIEAADGSVMWSPYTGHPMIYEARDEAEFVLPDLCRVVRYVPARSKR